MEQRPKSRTWAFVPCRVPIYRYSSSMHVIAPSRTAPWMSKLTSKGGWNTEWIWLGQWWGDKTKREKTQNVCVCVCVCLCVCLCVCMCVVFKFMRVHACVSCKCICRARVCVCAYMYTCERACMYSVRVCVCVPFYMCMCAHLHSCVPYVPKKNYNRTFRINNFQSGEWIKI